MRRATEDSTCANSMWILENAKANHGGGLQFGVPLRLRHIASSSYLTVLCHPVFSHCSVLAISADPECAYSTNSLFSLHPLDEDTRSLTSTTPVQLQHHATGPPSRHFPSFPHQTEIPNTRGGGSSIGQRPKTCAARE